jgi:two-component system LytT family response regulator
MKKIRTLVVDDEPLARERLTSLLSAEPDIEVVGQCRDGEEAVTAIVDHSPDLVFLDVQMPAMNGFEVIDAVGPERMPLVIFVTAYDQHALRAFQVRALDYVLKPFDRERFQEALQRARTSSVTRPAISAAGCWRSSRTFAATSRRPIGSW